MNRSGLTLLEMLVASSILSVTVAGTMAAFVTAVRIQRGQNGPVYAEAVGYAEQMLETNRNRVAMDTDNWFQARADLAYVGPPVPAAWPTFSGAWDDDANISATLKRRYKVWREDCDGDGTADARCYRIAVRTCWNDAVSCP